MRRLSDAQRRILFLAAAWEREETSLEEDAALYRATGTRRALERRGLLYDDGGPTPLGRAVIEDLENGIDS